MDNAFLNCKKLEYVEFEANSKLKSIGKCAFSSTKITKILIESNVTVINNHAFDNCMQLKIVQFSENSNLQLIDEYAFHKTMIEEIEIPSHIKIISQYSFSECENLKSITFAQDSELKIIDKNAFNLSGLESIFIPASVTDLVEGWCRNTDHLFNVVIDENNECFKYIEDSMIIGKSNKDKENYDVLCFVRRDIEQIIIPSYIKRISSYAFDGCTRLKNIEFQENSELESLGKYSFYNSTIEYISIPSSVKRIEKNAFENCKELVQIIFPENSELESIGEYAFSNSTITNINIPSKVKILKLGWCCNTPNLINVVLSPNNKRFSYVDDSFIIEKDFSNTLSYLHFARRNIENVIIPSFIRTIEPYAFNECKFIKSLQFIRNSELISIGNYAFCVDMRPLPIFLGF